MARVVFFLIGLLLSVTAVLKLWMLMTDPFADLVTGFPTGALWLAVYSEAAVAWIVLVPPVKPEDRSLAVAILFGAFAVVSTVRVIGGSVSCGCLGAMNVSPKVSLVVSVIIFVFSLTQYVGIVRRPINDGQLSVRWARLPQVTGWIAGVLVAAGISIGFSKLNSQLVTPLVTGDLVRAEASLDGAPAEAAIRLVNHSGSPVTVIGMQRSCQCMSTRLPICLAAGATTAIPLTIKATGVQSLFSDVKGRVQAEF